MNLKFAQKRRLQSVLKRTSERCKKNRARLWCYFLLGGLMLQMTRCEQHVCKETVATFYIPPQCAPEGIVRNSARLCCHFLLGDLMPHVQMIPVWIVCV